MAPPEQGRRPSTSHPVIRCRWHPEPRQRAVRLAAPTRRPRQPPAGMQRIRVSAGSAAYEPGSSFPLGILHRWAEGRLSTVLAASASGACALRSTSPLRFDVMSPFSSRLRFWSARGTDVTATCGSPRWEEAGRGVLSWHSPGCRAREHVARATSAERVDLGPRGQRFRRAGRAWDDGSVGCRRAVLVSCTPLLSLDTVISGTSLRANEPIAESSRELPPQPTWPLSTSRNLLATDPTRLRPISEDRPAGAGVG